MRGLGWQSGEEGGGRDWEVSGQASRRWILVLWVSCLKPRGKERYIFSNFNKSEKELSVEEKEQVAVEGKGKER